jgi:histidine triad (HIT) family protein
MSDCLFCKIVLKEIPAHIVYEDEQVLGFLDIRPVHAGHVLVIPRLHSADLSEMPADDLGPSLEACQKIGNALLKLGADGFNVITNAKMAAGQIVHHTHFHVIPRYKADGLHHWPQTPYPSGQDIVWKEKLTKALE